MQRSLRRHALVATHSPLSLTPRPRRAGILPDFLASWLSANLPAAGGAAGGAGASAKKASGARYVLGVSDPKLGAALAEKGVPCECNDRVLEAMVRAPLASKPCLPISHFLFPSQTKRTNAYSIYLIPANPSAACARTTTASCPA